MSAIVYRIRQARRGGEIWTSPETFTAKDILEVRQAVVAGFLRGEPRWAENLQGETLFGLDKDGTPQLKAEGLATIQVPAKSFYLQVREPGKRWAYLDSSQNTTRLKMRAARIASKEKADEYARKYKSLNPELEFRVV